MSVRSGEVFWFFLFFPAFTVCVLLSVWVESLIISWAGLFSGCLCDEAERKHFLAVSWGQCAWKVFEACEIQDKIDVHLSLCGFLSLPLVPHICPLFTAFLTPPQLRGFNWMWRHIKGGGGGWKGWSHSSGASRTSHPSSPQRQDCVSCQLRSIRMGSAKSAHASEYQVKNQVPPRRKKETS